MINDLSKHQPQGSTWSKGLVLVTLLGLVTTAILVFLLVYVYQQTPSKPFDMMR